ncbi:MAG: hypothetical protein BYD32DRAFT_477609 [Podila humilis]|nr:MAG: hypothetical protein BYD32DRAFT_477609 [Podila humilis]
MVTSEGVQMIRRAQARLNKSPQKSSTCLCLKNQKTAIFVEAVTKNLVLEKIDDLFHGVVNLPKGEHPHVFERIQSKIIAFSGELLPPLREAIKKKSRPKKQDTTRNKSAHEHEDQRLAMLQEAKERELLGQFREEHECKQERLLWLQEEQRLEEEREERLQRRQRTVDVENDASGVIAPSKQLLLARK